MEYIVHSGIAGSGEITFGYIDSETIYISINDNEHPSSLIEITFDDVEEVLRAIKLAMEDAKNG